MKTKGMNKQGVALVFTLIVVLVLSIIFSAFFMRSINDNNLVKRHVYSTRALWLAEAGVAQAMANLPTMVSFTDTLGGNSAYQFGADSVTLISHDAVTGEDVYRIEARGWVVLPSAGTIERNIESYVRLSPPQPGDFTAAIEAQGILDIRGNPTITGDVLPDSRFTFEGKFNLTTAEIKAIATAEGHYYEDPPSPLQDFYGLNWVKITDPSKKLQIPRTGWQGDGILIVEGQTDMEGGVFDGILWVIGELKISGNPTITGTVVAECGAEVTDVVGTPTLTYSESEITDALNVNLNVHARRTALSWREL